MNKFQIKKYIHLENRDVFHRSVPRGIEARFICQQNGLNDLEQQFLDNLSYRIVHEQQRLTVIFPITMAALSFLQNASLPMQQRSISTHQIVSDKNILFRENIKMLEHFSTTYQLYWPSENEDQLLPQRLLSIYSDVLEISNDRCLKLKTTGDRLTDTALLMKLVMYRNTCLHLFSKPAFILLACQSDAQVRNYHNS